MLLIAAAPAPSRDQLLATQRGQAAELAAQAAAQSTADAAEAEARHLTTARVAAAARLRVTDDAMAAAAAKVDDLAHRHVHAQALLAAHAKALGPLLPLIERLSLYPAETLLAVPMPPEQAVRGLLVLGGITRRLQADAASIKAEQAGIAVLQQQLDLERAALDLVAADQSREASALDKQVAAAQVIRGAAQDQATAAARRAAADAARANSIRAAIATLEAARRTAEARAQSEARAQAFARSKARPQAAAEEQPATAAAPMSAPVIARAGWAAPVSGRMVQAFGASTDAGPAHGVAFATPPGARVVSPCTGRIVFSGPFRSFGMLLIVDCGDDVHVVLAGLTRLDGHIGQAVATGEPIGVMAQWDPSQPEAARPSLYVELRRGGQAINPAPYLHSSNDHVPHLQRTA